MRRRILLVTPFGTGAVDHGGGLAVRGLIRALAARHDLVLVRPAGRDADDTDLESACAAVHVFGEPRPPGPGDRGRRWRGLLRGRTAWATELQVDELRSALPALVAHHGSEVVQVELSVLGDALSVVQGAQRVLTIHDPARSPWGRPPRTGLRRGVDRLHRVAAIRQEQRALRHADAVAALTEEDLRVLRSHRHLPREMAVIPLGWPVPDRPLDPRGESATLLYVGNFNHPPNADAALRLATRVLPLVWAVLPDTSLEIVGPDPSARLQAVADHRVRVVGGVGSVEPYLDRATVVVAPITTGGGIRIKLLEALAAGKATVTTSLGAQGIAAASEGALRVADSDAELAATVISLISDPKRRVELGNRAREWAQRELSLTTVAERYEALYDRLLGPATGLGSVAPP